MKIAKLNSLLFCLASAALLVIAFSGPGLSFLAWFGLVPMFFALDGLKPWAAFRRAFLCGLIFFTGTLYWFFNIARWFGVLAALGIILLLTYLALYFGLFGLAYAFFSQRKPTAKIVLLPSAWAVLEALRARCFTGFDWVSLGHSQAGVLPVIQIADMTGVFGVSFLVVMVNVLVKELVAVYLGNGTFNADGRGSNADLRRSLSDKNLRPSVCNLRLSALNELSVPLLATTIAVLAVLIYGNVRLSTIELSGSAAPRMKVAVVQPNIPQEMKWRASAAPLIVGEHLQISEEVARDAPDLIIWPESSCPDYLWEEREQFDRIRAFVRRVRIPLLLGSVVKEGHDYFNTAILLSADGEAVGIYRKVHLVPFGEFIPLRRFVPFVTDMLGIGDFTRGTERTVLRLPGPREDRLPGKDKLESGRLFSVLICFEDTVARLTRGFVRNGAQLLVNITNDAWFGDTKAPYLHLKSASFRAVENRRALVRAANTGASCFIDATGRAADCVARKEDGRVRRTYVRGSAIKEVALTGRSTFYTKFGDVFAILCFGCILMGIATNKKEKSY